MATTVEDVHEGDREDVRLLGSGEVGNVGVERNALLGSTSLGNSQADTQDSISTKLALVGGSIELVEQGIDCGLVLDIDILLDESGSKDLVDILDSGQDTCRSTSLLVFFSPRNEQRKSTINYTNPFRPIWTCHHHEAQRPRADLDITVSISEK